MKLWKKISISVVFIVAIIAAVIIVCFALGVFGVPHIKNIENRWGNVSDNETQITTEVTVENPNPFNVKLSSIHYEIYLNNISIAEGKDESVNLKHGITILEYITDVNTSRIPEWWSSHVNNNETTTIIVRYEADTGAGLIHKSDKYEHNTIQTNLLSELKLEEPKKIFVPYSVYDEFHLLTATNFIPKWELITEEMTIINTSVTLYNPNSGYIEVIFFNYEFFMNDFEVGWGYLENKIMIPGGSAVVVKCKTIIYNENLVEWFSSHVENSEYTKYQITSNAKFIYNGESYIVEPINIAKDFATDILD